MAHPALSSLKKYGLEGEVKLLASVSVHVGEPVTKTKYEKDTMDMEGATTFSELKRRSSDWSYHDEKIKREGWLMPSSKVMRGWECLSDKKKVFFFYFWMCDKSLWVYEMKEGDFTGSKDHFIPHGHYDNQLHVRIPEEKWTKCAVLSDVVFEEDLCWIE